MASAKKVFANLGAGFHRLFQNTSNSVSDGRSEFNHESDQKFSLPYNTQHYTSKIRNENGKNKDEND